MAALTPPVALSCYAAASVAGADVTRLSLIAVKLALAGFLIPYMFVYNHGLLLMTGPLGALYALSTAVPGFVAMAIGVSGWFYGNLTIWRRALLITGAVLLIWGGIATDLMGLAMIGASCLSQFYYFKNQSKLTKNDSVVLADGMIKKVHEFKKLESED